MTLKNINYNKVKTSAVPIQVQYIDYFGVFAIFYEYMVYVQQVDPCFSQKTASPDPIWGSQEPIEFFSNFNGDFQI